jgi:hypothetical protein
MSEASEMVRRVFNQAIEQTSDPDKVANLELCREYFTNPEFRKALEDHTAKINGI